MNGPRRIPPRLARRLDRLARRAHAFHRFAHHPACHEYAGEVFRFGRRTRICRGCALAAMGAIAGTALGLVSPAEAPLALISVLLAAALALASLRARSIGKVAGRFLSSALLVFGTISGIRTGSWFGLGIALASTVFLIRAYRIRGPHRGPCRACPERDGPSPCRGFAPIVRRERAFSRRASILLDAK